MIWRLAALACVALLLPGGGGAHAAGWLDTRVAIEDFAVVEDYESALALGDELLTRTRAALTIFAAVCAGPCGLVRTRDHGALLSARCLSGTGCPIVPGAHMLRAPVRMHIPQIAEGDYGFARNRWNGAAP